MDYIHGCEWDAAAAAKSLQSCPTLCDPIDGSPPGSLVPGILQARTLDWVAISFSNVWKWKVKVKLLSRVRPLATPWTAAHQAPPPMGFLGCHCLPASWFDIMSWNDHHSKFSEHPTSHIFPLWWELLGFTLPTTFVYNIQQGSLYFSFCTSHAWY